MTTNNNKIRGERLSGLLLGLGSKGGSLLLLKGLSDGLAVHGALVVTPGASNIGPGGSTQIGSEVVFSLGTGGIDDAVVAEESSDQGLFLIALLSGEGLNLADEPLAAVIVVHVGNGVEVAVDLIEASGGLVGGGAAGDASSDSTSAISGSLVLLAEVTEVLGGKAGNVGSNGLLDNTGTNDANGNSDGASRGEESGQGAGGEGNSAGAKAEDGKGADLGVGDGNGADEGGKECQDLGVHCES